MTNITIRKVVILGAIAIIGILAIQSYWVKQTWDIKEKEFHQTVQVALLQVAENLSKLSQTALPRQNLISQRSSNSYAVNINGEIDANSLEYYLQSALEARALNVDFEYGIHDCANDKMVYGNYISYSDKKIDKQKEDLPKYDEFIYYFVVRFPNNSGQVLGQMWLAILFSIILMVAVLFFIYSIFVILRQKRLSEMQKDFINNMTHEFKTPISTIKISADVFINHPAIKQDERLSRYANIIKEQNLRLNHQVEKVLQLAKIERDSFKLSLEPINLHDLLNEIIDGSRLKVDGLKGELITTLNAVSPMINADKLHLCNILDNLIDNAIKYRKGAPQISITTKDDSNDNIILSIEDKGIGIDSAYQAKVFNKFYRVPTGNVHNVKGFGLGLFYFKNVCDAHGWKINLESEPNIGTNISLAIDKLKNQEL